jgi:hypothetical protein
MMLLKQRNNLFLLVFILAQFISAQKTERQVLKGKIIADSIEVADIAVFNISTNISAITDIDGAFFIKAKATDTLFFQGLSFVSQKYILTKNDFNVEELEIQLTIKINELNEVVVSPSTLTGNLNVDTNKIKVYGGFTGIDMNVVKYYEDDSFYKGPEISTSPNHFAPGGATIDFKIIGKGIGKLLGIKRNSKKNATAVFEERKLHEIQSKSFADHIKERYSHHFFIASLKLRNEEITPFLTYSELSSYQLVELLKVENELQLIEYLIYKASEFKKNIREELIPLENENKN